MSQFEFKNALKAARNILVITGAGISAESNIPTFRGAPALRWRNYKPSDLANFPAFRKDSSLVWEFYHYRREICLQAKPNPAHFALAEFEKKCKDENKVFTLITQNVDGLHKRAGSKEIIPIHGELFETRCTKCDNIKENFNSPICEALKNRGDPTTIDVPVIPKEQLPRCELCKGLLRPNVVWFGEALRVDDIENSYKSISKCEICLVIGTSAVVEPVASFPLKVMQRHIPVYEFNTEKTPLTDSITGFFRGPCALVLPPLLE
nr:sirtuin-5-like protein [Dugesia japonica]